MTDLAYEVVDVFTSTPFAGNPLAVLLGGDGLQAASMQALAREFNLSETVFAVAPEPGADYGLRIFTPTVELPFAGHPSVGAAWVLHRRGLIPAGPVVQSCGAGLLPVTVSATGAELTGGPPTLGAPLDPAPLLAAVGLGPGDLAGTPRRAGCGIEFTILPVAAHAVARADADPVALRALDLGTGLSVVAWTPPGSAHARVFVPEVGVAEDPATGSAAVALGVWLAASGLVPDGTTAYEVRQGAEVGRPSTLRCTVTASGGAAVATTVAGDVVAIAAGEVRVP